MRFSSLLFLLYFLPISLAGYHLLRFSMRAQNGWLLLCSLVFYACGSLVYAGLLVVCILVNYALGFSADRARQRGGGAMRVVIPALLVNLVPLFVFSYLPGILASIEDSLGITLSVAIPTAPLGIAFISLQGISYVMDIYRGKTELEENLVHCGLYLSFFPTLFAGPLLRFQDVAGQIRRRTSNWQQFFSGLRRFFLGLTKYVLLAQPLAALTDMVFNTSNISGVFSTVPASMALLGLLGFAVQIYYQLSGFSDMALGLGGMFGFRYPENFNYPVLAASVTDFWRRGYRSLTAWFEEYVYAPLRARASNRDREVLYNIIMWALIGLWLGPGVSNLIFALWFFAFLTFEQIVEFETSRIRKVFRHLYVGIIMLIGLIPLRTTTIYELSLFLSNLLGINGNGFWNDTSAMLLREFGLVLLVGIVFLFPVAPWFARVLASRHGVTGMAARAVYAAGALALAALVFIYIARGGMDASLLTDYTIWRMIYG